jgi:hypothetical protein
MLLWSLRLALRFKLGKLEVRSQKKQKIIRPLIHESSIFYWESMPFCFGMPLPHKLKQIKGWSRSIPLQINLWRGTKWSQPAFHKSPRWNLYSWIKKWNSAIGSNKDQAHCGTGSLQKVDSFGINGIFMQCMEPTTMLRWAQQNCKSLLSSLCPLSMERMKIVVHYLWAEPTIWVTFAVWGEEPMLYIVWNRLKLLYDSLLHNIMASLTSWDSIV